MSSCPRTTTLGNAVGAVCSKISETVTVQICPKEYKYIMFAPGSTPMEYSHVEEAIAAGRSFAEFAVREKLLNYGADDIRVRTEVKETLFSDGYGQEMKFINQVDIRATATGKPRLRDH